MKNSIVKGICALCVALVIGIGLSACSFPLAKPEEGVWYCEELMIEIDFDAYHENQTQHCAKIYNPDGTFENVLCQFDYGSVINICSEDQQEHYLIGNFLYRQGIFSVTTIHSKETYVFNRKGDE